MWVNTPTNLSVWSVYEQVLFAALDNGDEMLALSCFAKLKEKFPKSQRVMRLKGCFKRFITICETFLLFIY
jgi:hypothetical protein